MKENLLIVIIISLFFFIHSSKVISILYNYKYLMINIKIQLIEEGINIYPFVNTYLQYSLIDDIRSKQLNESKLKETFYENRIEKFKGNRYQTDVQIGDIKVTDYSMYVTKEPIAYIPDQGIALAFKFEDESFSLVHQLFKNNYIDNKFFAFETTSDYKNGTIHFGQIPNNKHLKTRYHGYCNVNEKYFTWGCNLTNIQYKNKNYPFNIYASFHSSFYGMIISKKFSDFIKEEVLKAQFENKTCGDNPSSFKCERDVIPEEDEIKIQLEQMILSIKVKELFDNDKLEPSSLVTFHRYEFYDNDFIFGIHFIDSYNFSVFDYDNKKIELYSNEKFIQMINENMYIIIKLYLFIILSLIVNIIFLFFFKIVKENRR